MQERSVLGNRREVTAIAPEKEVRRHRNHREQAFAELLHFAGRARSVAVSRAIQKIVPEECVVHGVRKNRESGRPPADLVTDDRGNEKAADNEKDINANIPAAERVNPA